MPVHPIDAYVGKQLKLRRNIRGMSQQALADSLGVTFQQVQKYESGANRMGSSRLYEAAFSLKIPVEYFFEGYSGGIPSHNDSSVITMGETGKEMKFDKSSSREALTLVRHFNNIKCKEVRKKIINLVRSISASEKDSD